jgi:D-hexose-6-phosphate mutarotase
MGVADLVRTALPAPVRVSGTGLPCVEVQTPRATSQVYFHGAQVTQWTPASQREPVLWMSEHSAFHRNKAIRGGVPICFPWFGAHGASSAAPAHGFARLVDWMLVEASEDDGVVTLAFYLRGKGFAHWPHSFRAHQRITIGDTLTMALEIENSSHAPIEFEEALHSYFAVGDITRVAVEGLEDTQYLDKVQGMAPRTQGHEPIRFSGETDRVFVRSEGACRVVDPELSRTIVVEKSGSQSTVVWNPGADRARSLPDFGDDEWRKMVCVETANVRDAAVRLDPGARHTMTATIRVE